MKELKIDGVFDLSDEEKAKKYFEDSKDYYDSREPITDRQLRQIYLDGLAEGRKEICKKILEEIRTHEGIEQMTKFYIGEIIKNLGVDL